MYLRAAKTEVEAAGESTDEMADSVSKLREELLSLTGQKVDIQLDSTTFKSSYQILKELSQVWDDINDVSKANILELIGGKRNSNVTSALLENFSIAEEAIEVAANSAGSAVKENEVYLDSITGKLQILQASFEELSTTSIESDSFKLLIDGATELVEWLDKVVDLLGLIPTLAGGASIAYSVKGIVKGDISGPFIAEFDEIRLAAKNTQKEFFNIFDQIKAATKETENSSLWFDTDDEIKRIQEGSGSLAEYFKQFSDSERDRDHYIQWCKDNGYEIEIVTKKSKVATAATKALNAAWATFKSIAISMAVQFLVTKIIELAQAAEKAREAAQEAADEFEETANSVETYKTKIAELKTSLDSGNLSEEEAYNTRKELLSIQDEIVEKLGKEAGAFDILKGSIDDVNVALDNYTQSDAIKKLRESSQAYKKAAEELSETKNFGSFVVGFDNGAESSPEQSQALRDIQNLVKEVFGDEAFREMSVYDAAGNALETKFVANISMSAKEAQDAISEFDLKFSNLQQKYKSNGLNLSELLFGDVGFDQFNSELAEIESSIDAIIEKYGENGSDFITLSIQADDDYRDLYYEMANAEEAFNDAVSKEDWDAAEEAATKISQLDTLVAGIDDTTAEGKYIKNYFEDLYQELLEMSEKYQLKIKFTTDENGLKTAIEDALAKVSGEKTESGFGNLLLETLNKRDNFENNVDGSLTGSERLEYYTEEEKAVLAIVAAFASVGVEVDSVIDKMVELGLLTSNVAETVSGIDYSSQIDALESKTKVISDIQDILDDIEDADGNLTLDVLNTIYEKYSDAAGKINDAASATEFLKEKLNEAKEAAKSAYIQMFNANEDWVAKTLNSNNTLTSTLTSIYSTQLTKWNEVANQKWTTDSTLVKRLSELWSRYSGVETESIKAQIDKLQAKNKSNLAKNGADLTAIIDDLSALYELRKEVEKGFDTIFDTSTTTTTSSKAVEKYVANLDKYREVLEQITQIQISRKNTQFELDNSDDLREQVELQRELVESYKDEQNVLHQLNEMRRDAIRSNLKTLSSYGVISTYNAETNELWFKNIEAIQNVSAGSTSATNDLIKELEDLYEATIDLNTENQESSSTWWDLKGSILDAKDAIVELLDAVVDAASEEIDAMQTVYSTLKDAAAEFAETGGYLTVDTFQSIISLGVEYMAYLQDENGQLVINEESIRNVVAARTEQLAIESALSYVEKLRIALQDNDTTTLEKLLNATVSTTGATWDLVNANLALLKVTDGMTESQFAAALRNINAMRSLSENVIANLDSSLSGASSSMTDYYEEMADGLESILDYVMDMIEDQVDRQIDALEDMKDAYSEIIELRKESIEDAKEEADRQKDLADKVKEMAKLQAKIDILSLDDSREAQAEKAALLEELKELQDEVADEQSDYALESQKDALDDMEKAYHEEKDKEIDILEDSISSTQKIYEAAINKIDNQWDSLYSELLSWNRQFGKSIESDIVSAWESASKAVQQYGSYAQAVAGVDAAKNAIANGTSNVVGVSGSYSDSGTSDEKMVEYIINRMYHNAQDWHNATDAKKSELDAENVKLGASLKTYGVNAYRDDKSGTWYVGNEKLFDKYEQYCYHTGGVVGGSPKDNEQFALLKNGEWVLTEEMVQKLMLQVERLGALSKSFNNTNNTSALDKVLDAFRTDATTSVSNVSNNSVTITFGDTIIHGENGSAVQKHVEVDREMVNQIAKILKLKW